MKILITHINPHLDDIAAIWLFKKFNPLFRYASLEFLKATSGAVTYENQPVDSSPDIVHFGIGRGKFDEHKGDVEDCATSLVWKDIIRFNFAPKDEIERAAIQKIVDWVTLEDTGKLPLGDYAEFSVPAFIRPHDSSQTGSAKAVQLGAEILDRILPVLKSKAQAEIDWKTHIEFESQYGKAFAIKSTYVDRVFCKQQGGDIFVMLDPKNGHVQFFTPSMDIDLEPIYKKVKELDTEADWFLHQSHHMVICGSGTAPDSKKTKLTFEELIEAAK